MNNSYSIIKQVIDLWEKFEAEESEEPNLLSFSEWIVERIKEKSVSNTKLESKHDFALHPETVSYVKNLDPKSRFQEYILRIARFEEFYIRKYLIDLPVNTRLEYLFLVTINDLDKVKKTDLINIHLVEYTTGMDTIRRLIKNGFMIELPDENDKRAKLLILTEEGKKILSQANKRINEERNMFLACISPNKWKKTLAVLHEIDELHHSIYLHHYDKPFAEISNLMDSLKYLHK